MVSNPDSEVIVHSTIELAHNLHLKTVAEGVEDEETWQHLADLGCDIAQGYFISKPLEADPFKVWSRESDCYVSAASR